MILTTFPLENVKCLRKELATHPVYAAVKDLDDLTIFMQYHIYSVWDFMSLVKYLQNQIAPSRTPWVPYGDAKVQRFINDIVLEEESDEGIPVVLIRGYEYTPSEGTAGNLIRPEEKDLFRIAAIKQYPPVE